MRKLVISLLAILLLTTPTLFGAKPKAGAGRPKTKSAVDDSKTPPPGKTTPKVPQPGKKPPTSPEKPEK